jgi:Fe2+ or Zn2+ uptake regulation protein
MIFEIFDHMLSDWVSFIAYPNLFGIKNFVVVIVGQCQSKKKEKKLLL